MNNNRRNLQTRIEMKLLKYLLLIFSLFACNVFAQQDVKFQVDAPATVVAGTNFKVSYVFNADGGTNFQLNEDFTDNVELYYGPSVSQASSVSIVNGQRSSSFKISYTYLLGAIKEGSITIPTASINAGGKTYTTKSVTIKVLPPDSSSNRSSNQSSGSSSNPQTGTVRSSGGKIDKNDIFVRINFSKKKIYEQEAVVATFRLYSKLDVISLTDASFPEFQGFVAQDFDLSSNRQFEIENYNGQNYYAIDIKKTLLFAQQAGKLTIPSGSLTLVVSVPSGKYVPDVFGVMELNEQVEKKLNTIPVTVDVSKLPSEDKPIDYSGGVGSFSIAAGVDKNKIEANSSIKYKITISGVGNIKLLKNPRVDFPKELEVFDPKVNNEFTISESGETGKREIEYVVIPRYPGEYEIPGLEFSYFDMKTSSYKTLHTDPIKLDVDKDPNATNEAVESNVRKKIENDIQVINTNKPDFKNYKLMEWGTLQMLLWYIIPVLLLIVACIIYRKRIEANADVIGSKMKKANKMAVKRLRVAKKYLKMNDKDKFYEESLRAIWGYLSDRLVIPVTDLNRDNIELELQKFNVDQSLVDELIGVLDDCEFERYAPTTSNLDMNNLYQKTLELIGKLENVLKAKR